jgi:tetratricopeptide (TPR) repeat protein
MRKDEADSLYRSGKFEEAESAYRALLTSEGVSKDPILLNLSATCLALGKYEESLQFADAVLSAQPKNDKALFRRASALHRLGAFDQALASIAKIIDRSRSEVASLEQALRKAATAPRDASEALWAILQEASGGSISAVLHLASSSVPEEAKESLSRRANDVASILLRIDRQSNSEASIGAIASMLVSSPIVDAVLPLHLAALRPTPPKAVSQARIFRRLFQHASPCDPSFLKIVEEIKEALSLGAPPEIVQELLGAAKEAARHKPLLPSLRAVDFFRAMSRIDFSAPYLREAFAVAAFEIWGGSDPPREDISKSIVAVALERLSFASDDDSRSSACALVENWCVGGHDKSTLEVHLTAKHRRGARVYAPSPR